RIQLTMSTPRLWSRPQITTSASTPSAALPSSSAVVMPASESDHRSNTRLRTSRTVIAPLSSSLTEHDRREGRGDEQQHDRCEDPDRRQEHRRPASNGFLVDLLASRV